MLASKPPPADRADGGGACYTILYILSKPLWTDDDCEAALHLIKHWSGKSLRDDKFQIQDKAGIKFLWVVHAGN